MSGGRRVPELQEIDRLIAGIGAKATAPAEAPEAEPTPPETAVPAKGSAGPSVQELDRLIATIPSATGAPKAVGGDLTGAMGAGVEGFQIGQATPEMAATPKVLPGVPSQAEVMAKPPGEPEAVIKAGGEPQPESLLRRFLGHVGLVDVEKARERERQREAAQATVQMVGGPERQQDLGPAGQALSGAAEAVTLGIPSAVARAAGMPTGRPPETTAEEIGHGAGQLAGFMVTPLAIGKATAAKTLGWLEPLATDSVAKVFAKEVARQAGVLGAASMAMETGQALSATDATEMAKIVAMSAGQGALLGATFGAVTQAIPDNTLIQTAARIGAGLALVDAQQGKTPWDDRAVAQKTFDYGLNVFFLFRGQNPREVLGRLQAEATRAGVDVDTFVRQAKPTQEPSAERLEVPTTPEAPLTPEAVLQHAQEASQRAETALRKVEELAKAPITPPPLEVPPETQPAPEVTPVTPRLEGVSPATTTTPILPQEPKPAEVAQLPPGRIAEPAPPEAPPAEVLPSAETKPVGKTEPPTPEDELAALRRELNPGQETAAQTETPAFRRANVPPSEIPPESPIVGLRRQLADLEERQERWVAERAKAIEKIRTGEDPEVGRQALAKIDGELTQISGDMRGLKRIIRRTAENQPSGGQIPPTETPAFREARQEPVPPFFSQLQREIDKRLPARATPEQIRNIVASGAVKADEVKWSGLEDYLAQLPPGQMVAKATLQTFLRENEVRVEEVQKADVEEPRRRFEDAQTIRARNEARIATPKFAKFTLPGGEQYRELLLTLLGRRVEPQLRIERIQEGERSGFVAIDDVTGRRVAAADTAERARQNALEQLSSERFMASYRSPHWEEPNVLAHVRFDDRVDASGKKVLFIEELQSDWHQEGRRKGYKEEPRFTSEEQELRRLNAITWQGGKWTPEQEARARDLQSRVGVALQERVNRVNTGVPEAPFAKTWHELVLKRMLRWAAEKGYDKVAWTTGEQQAERYDLSKHIQKLVYEPPMGQRTHYILGAVLHDGRQENLGAHEAADLSNVVGKDVADRILRGEGRYRSDNSTTKVLEGLDLKVGGEGMKAFYDQIVPQFLNKYGKKWVARVGTTELNLLPEHLRGIKVEGMTEKDTTTVPALDITPEMRRSVVQEGQPMFMRAKTFMGVDPTWEADWQQAFQTSIEHGRIVPGTGVRLVDTWAERTGDELSAFARQAPYLKDLVVDLRRGLVDVQRAIRRDHPTLPFVDVFAVDLGFHDYAVTFMRTTRPMRMAVNPYQVWRTAEEHISTMGGFPDRRARLRVFEDEFEKTIFHELAHALTGEHLETEAVFQAERDLRPRYRGILEPALRRIGDQLAQEGTYERFTNDYDSLRSREAAAHERRGIPNLPPEDVARQPTEYLPPSTPPTGESRGGVRVGAQAGGAGGPRPEVGVGDVRPIPQGFPTPELGGGGPARREAGQPPESARPDLTDRVAEAGKKFPQEDFARWAESMRGALGPGVESYLKPAWDKIKGVEATAKGEPPPPPSEPPKPPVEPPAKITEPAPEEPGRPEAAEPPPEGPPPLQEPILTLGRHKEVVDAAGEMFQRAGIERDQGQWPVLSDQILDAMREGTLELPVMREVLQAHGLTLAEFGESMFRPAVKNAAQRLQMLSVLQRRLNRMAIEAGRGTEADALLNLAQQVETLRREGGDEPPLKEMSWWRRADNIRRGLLVTQLATAMRNLETQLGRLPIDVLDQATQKVFGGKTTDPWAAWESFTETLSQLRPTKGGMQARKASQSQIEALLQAFPKEWDRLFGSYSSDVARQAKEGGTPLSGADQAFTQAEKVVNLLNFFNRFQEFAVRRSVFWSDFASRMERRGMDAETLATGKRRLTSEEWDTIAPDVKASVQKALEMTFAQNAPYRSFAWHMIQGINKVPIILTGPVPFPRFMVNSLKFLYEFSPMPFLTGKVFTAAERAKFAAGDRQTISRATIGTAALLGAWLVRETQPDDNKWYEVDVPGLGTTDIRPFNPFASYFFLGELAKRGRSNTLYKIESGDIIRGIASANVRGGLGLFGLDKLVQGLGELSKTGKLVEALSSAGGELLSGLLVPLRTLTDLYAQFDPEWQVVRERRGEPFLGPAKAQFGIGEPQYLPTRAEPQKREQPAIRQATGITKVSEKNDFEKELDRMQFNRREILGPSTGDPVADNVIAKHMGQLAESQTLAKINSLRYQGLSEPQRMEWLRTELTRIRAIARSRAKREEPELFKEVEAERVPARRRLLNQERESQGLAPLRR